MRVACGMSPKILALVIALVAGISMAIQGSINTKLGQVIGNWEAILVVQVVGLATILVLLFVFGVGQGNLSLITQGPWYSLLGGLTGVFIENSNVGGFSQSQTNHKLHQTIECTA
jgi:transporter family-2 protein